MHNVDVQFSDRSFKTRIEFWVVWMVFHVALLVFSFVLANQLDRTVGIALAAVAYGFASVQIGFLAHDFEHGQVMVSRRWRRPLGLLCWNVLLGVSLNWWREKHGCHHQHTQIQNIDPDLYSLFVYCPIQACQLKGARRWFVACQNWLFWPVAAFARWYFQWLSLLSIVRMPTGRQFPELVGVGVHHGLVWGMAWTMLGEHALAFVLLGQLFSGLYMVLSFSVNHLGMPLAAQRGQEKLWQIQHTRNIRVSRFGSYLLGGLDLQIEHHLYPGWNRDSLREIKPMVEQQCREKGIRYHQVGWKVALAEVQESLVLVARKARSL